jgi:hypothetical protein
VKKNSQQERISSRLIYRVAYINKWNSIALRLNFELMNRVCEHYNVLHWISKRKYNIFLRTLKWESCCKKDDVVLFALRNFSQLLRELLIEQNSRERDFRQNIQSFNFVFTFTFVNYRANSRIVNRLNNDREFVVFQIQIKLYHFQESLHSIANNTFVFVQFFFTIRMKRSQHEMHNIRN